MNLEERILATCLDGRLSGFAARFFWYKWWTNMREHEIAQQHSWCHLEMPLGQLWFAD